MIVQESDAAECTLRLRAAAAATKLATSRPSHVDAQVASDNLTITVANLSKILDTPLLPVTESHVMATQNAIPLVERCRGCTPRLRDAAEITSRPSHAERAGRDHRDE